jgi:hypothetical protein
MRGRSCIVTGTIERRRRWKAGDEGVLVTLPHLGIGGLRTLALHLVTMLYEVLTKSVNAATAVLGDVACLVSR